MYLDRWCPIGSVFAGDVLMKLKVVLENSDEGGYTVFVPSLPGCVSEGDTREQALANIKEAIELYLEPVEDDSDFAPTAEIVEVAI
jgi:predicted RNase H-like HicB family nuclease